MSILDQVSTDVDTASIQAGAEALGMADWLNGPTKLLEYLVFTRVVAHQIRKAIEDQDSATPTPERLAVDLYLTLQSLSKNDWLGIKPTMKCGNPIPDEIAGYVVALHTLQSVHVYGMSGHIYRRLEEMGYKVSWLENGNLEVIYTKGKAA